MINPASITFRLSTKLGSSGNSMLSVPDDSLGKYVSQKVMTSGLNNLFEKVRPHPTIGETDYRCLFIMNTDNVDPLVKGKVWLDQDVADGCELHLAVDLKPASPKASTAAQAAFIVDELTPPTNVGAFKVAGVPILLDTIPPNYVRALWIKRIMVSVKGMRDGTRINVGGY